MRFVRLLAATVLIASGAIAQAPQSPRLSVYERHVVFDNARIGGSFYYAPGEATAPSKLLLENGKLSVDTARFHSAPNALKLDWTSANGGGWWATISAQRMRGLTDYEGDTLSLWVWSDAELNAGNTPRILVADSAGQSRPAIDLITTTGPIAAQTWTRIAIPFSAFEGQTRQTDDLKFDPAKLRDVTLVQGLDDGKPHRMWIDDVRVEDSTLVDTAAPAMPRGLSAQGFDRHVELAWPAPTDGDVESWRIYRAGQDGIFSPIGIQRVDRLRYVDFAGLSNFAGRYRITAVDSAGNESAPSVTVTARTRPFNDEELLTMVQQANFRFYWEGAQPDSGMALEVVPGDPDQIALGSSGWGVNAIVAGASRGFVTRDAALARMERIVGFLGRVPRFHGVWPHFIDGRTAQPMAYFGKYDDGGDLVETAFMIQGLLTAKQYFDRPNSRETALRTAIDRFWKEVEWDWYRKEADSRYLYWHWSPKHGFYINHPLIGWNESGIVYLLAIASPTHPVPASLWHSGFASRDARAVAYRQGWSRTTQGDHYVNGGSYYGVPLAVGEGSGAELFFPQFNFMGLDPKALKDGNADYFANSRALAKIAQAYAIANPRGCKGYGANAWGRSAGINAGGGRSQPVDDNCTLVIHASLGMMPFAPDEAMAALKHYYRDLGAGTWGIYGFIDSFNQRDNLFDEQYMALNQAPTVAMIENHRTGLIWKLFMRNPEIAPAVQAIAASAPR